MAGAKRGMQNVGRPLGQFYHEGHEEHEGENQSGKGPISYLLYFFMVFMVKILKSDSMSLYLYCLRESSGTAPGTCPTPSGTCHALSVINALGVNGKGGVFIRAFDGIEAVVSEVNGDNFGEMQKKAQEDIYWIKEKALAHEAVVEEAMGLSRSERDKGGTAVVAGVGDPGPASPRPATACPEQGRRVVSYRRPGLFPVIPVKFGVIFNNEERLAKIIGEQGGTIKAAFDRIRSKQEWSFKLFLKDNQKFKDQVREQNELFREKSKALADLPAGKAYFMEEEFNRELEHECSQRLANVANQTFEELKPYACEAALVKILNNKLTGRSERMALNSVYLVADSHLPEFKNAVAIMSEKLTPEGFLVEQSGPWPPYHFTEFANE